MPYNIKPLVWLKGSDSRWYATTVLGPICVAARHGRAEWWFERHGVAGYGSDVEDAKRNAEAEYKRLLLAALEGVT